MDIFITGAQGQLGKELIKKLSQSHSVIGFGKKDLDITRKEDVEHAILTNQPKIIIHTAAFTKVDECEIDRKQAFEVNSLGTGYVAQTATYVNDLIEAIIQLLDKKNGIYHVSNSGSCTWYEFARSIFAEAGFNPELVQPTTTEEYGSLAPRPGYSVLGQNAILGECVEPLRPWNEALKDFIRREI